MSDYNNTGWVAVYEREAKAQNYEGREDIHSWNSEGTALIVDRRTGDLIAARFQPGFKRVEETSRVVAALPATPGWNLKIWEGDSTESASFVAPIAGWLVTETGQFVAVSGSNDSYLEPTEHQRTEIQSPTEAAS